MHLQLVLHFRYVYKQAVMVTQILVKLLFPSF